MKVYTKKRRRRLFHTIFSAASVALFRKEVERVQPVAGFIPLLIKVFGLDLEKELLERLVEFADEPSFP